MKPYKPERIYIEKDALRYPHTRKILSRLPDVPVEETEDSNTPSPSPLPLPGGEDKGEGESLQKYLRKKPDPIGEGKRYLLLRRDKGRSFKPFPESEQYLSCDYFTLHLAEGCDLECSYCILQAYLTNPLLTVYVNLEEILENLSVVLRENPDRFFRIGTGQLADSLSLDHLTGFSEALVPFFARQPNAVLELKTKSTQIERLLRLEPCERTIVSWSLNSKKIQREEEHKCASIEERLQAARKVIEAGYRVGFHLDPIMDYLGWEKDYGEVIDEIFARIPGKRIAWISLGCLRFMPALKSIMENRFPKSKLPLGEWIQGMDGKMRYFKPRRIEIYRKAVERIRRQNSSVTLYLSMESPEVWRRVFGGTHTKNSVCRLLDQAGTPAKFMRSSSR